MSILSALTGSLKVLNEFPKTLMADPGGTSTNPMATVVKNTTNFLQPKLDKAKSNNSSSSTNTTPAPRRKYLMMIICMGT